MAKFQDSSGGDGENGNDGGRAPARPRGQLVINEPRCHVCQSQHRKDVDRYIAMGLSQAEVCRFFEALDGTIFTRKSMSTHVRKHMTLHSHAVRSIIEDEAREVIENIDEVKGFLVTKKAALKIAMQSAYENIMSGTTLVEPETLLKIIDKLEAWEREEQEASVDEMKRDFNAFANAVKELIEFMAPKLGTTSDALFSQLYTSYERALANDHVPLVLRGAVIEMPAIGMADFAFEDAEFEITEGGDDEDGSE